MEVRIGGSSWRIVGIRKDARGRPYDCALYVDAIVSRGRVQHEVRITGSKDPRPIEEPGLPFPISDLAGALITLIVFPEQAALMLQARAPTADCGDDDASELDDNDSSSSFSQEAEP